jgi:hypothetical protein
MSASLPFGVRQRLLERTLRRTVLNVREVRDELRILDEQLAYVESDLADKELRAMVAETPSTAYEHHDALRHVEVMRAERERLVARLRDLEREQDAALDRLGS